MVVSLLGFGKIGGFLGFPYIEHVTDVTGYSIEILLAIQ